jgi:PAS domain S-box-containing protein
MLEESVHLERAIQFGKRMADDEASRVGFEAEKENFLGHGRTVLAEIERNRALVERMYERHKTHDIGELVLEIDYELRNVDKEHADSQFFAERVFNLLSQGKLREAESTIQMIKETSRVEYAEQASPLEHFSQVIENFVENSAVRARKSARNTTIGMASISALILFVSLALGVSISRSITEPVQAAMSVASRIAEGERELEVPVDSRDEMGSLLTALKHMAKALSEADADQRRLITIMESTSDLISIARPDTGLMYMNGAGKAMVGWPDDVNVATKIIADVHPEWALDMIRDEGIPAAIRDGVWQGETALLAPDGTEISVSQVIMSHKSPSGELEYLSTIMRDIAQRKKMEEALKRHTALLERVNAELEERNRELDEFTYIASHDLQEPLRKLTAFSHLLREDMQKDEREEVSNDLQVISSAAQHMQTLVQDLLALSRSGRKSMKWEEVALDECVTQALDVLEVRVSETGAQIRRGALPTVRGDRRLLTQLFQNLIGNALKFHGKEPLLIELSAEKAGNRWILGVDDNGIGLKPEYAEQIFLPFKQLHGRHEYGGTGIGLAICRKIVERHGGSIWVESEPGNGAHFKFTIRELDRKESE